MRSSRPVRHVEQTSMEEMHLLQQRQKAVPDVRRLWQDHARLGEMQLLQRVWKHHLHRLRRERRQVGDHLGPGIEAEGLGLKPALGFSF